MPWYLIMMVKVNFISAYFIKFRNLACLFFISVTCFTVFSALLTSLTFSDHSITMVILLMILNSQIWGCKCHNREFQLFNLNFLLISSLFSLINYDAEVSDLVEFLLAAVWLFMHFSFLYFWIKWVNKYEKTCKHLHLL